MASMEPVYIKTFEKGYLRNKAALAREKMMCAFCQNYDISHQSAGRKVEPEALAGMMLELQSRGCHNLNFATPSHVIPRIPEGLEIAKESPASTDRGVFS